MSSRRNHAVQASLVSAIAALVVSWPLLLVFRPVDNLIAGALTASGASAVITLVLWYLAFPDLKASPKRGLWVGPLIVFLAMWVMFSIVGIGLDATYLGNEGPGAVVAKSVFMGLFFAAFGSLYTGLFLFPISMGIAVYLRKWQAGELR